MLARDPAGAAQMNSRTDLLNSVRVVLQGVVSNVAAPAAVQSPANGPSAASQPSAPVTEATHVAEDLRQALPLRTPFKQPVSLRNDCAKFLSKRDLLIPGSKARPLNFQGNNSKTKASANEQSVSTLQSQLEEMSQKQKRLERLADNMLQQRCIQQEQLQKQQDKSTSIAVALQQDAQGQGKASVARKGAVEGQRLKDGHAVVPHLNLEKIQDPWLARSVAHEASLQSARKLFKFVAEKAASSSSPRHRSPRVTLRDSTVEVEERLDAQRADVACLYVAERFRSFLKRANARKPDWL